MTTETIVCPACDEEVDLCDKCARIIHHGDTNYFTGIGQLCDPCGREYLDRPRCTRQRISEGYADNN